MADALPQVTVIEMIENPETYSIIDQDICERNKADYLSLMPYPNTESNFSQTVIRHIETMDSIDFSGPAMVFFLTPKAFLAQHVKSAHDSVTDCLTAYFMVAHFIIKKAYENTAFQIIFSEESPFLLKQQVGQYRDLILPKKKPPLSKLEPKILATAMGSPDWDHAYLLHQQLVSLSQKGRQS